MSHAPRGTDLREFGFGASVLGMLEIEEVHQGTLPISTASHIDDHTYGGGYCGAAYVQEERRREERHQS